MRTFIVMSLFLAFQFTFAEEGSKEASAKEGLAALLPRWTEKWNKADVDGIMALQHPECKMRKAFDRNAESKKIVNAEFSEIIKEYGEIKSSKVGKFIAAKNRYVVKIEYATKGLTPGTMALKQDKDGNWLVLDFNIDGQNEPELKE